MPRLLASLKLFRRACVRRKSVGGRNVAAPVFAGISPIPIFSFPSRFDFEMKMDFAGIDFVSINNYSSVGEH
jgi:hypothetical protein